MSNPETRQVRVLAFSGSARRASINQQLVEAAADVAVARGAEVTLVNLRDYPMPLFNQDDEAESGEPIMNSPGGISIIVSFSPPGRSKSRSSGSFR